MFQKLEDGNDHHSALNVSGGCNICQRSITKEIKQHIETNTFITAWLLKLDQSELSVIVLSGFPTGGRSKKKSNPEIKVSMLRPNIYTAENIHKCPGMITVRAT